MTYHKPEVAVLSRAVEAVQGSTNKSTSFLYPDAIQDQANVSMPAYEADE